MTNLLIAARNSFSQRHPETRTMLNGRDWGVIDTGGDGPTLVLIPGTLGRADIFWQVIDDLAPRLRVISLSYPVEGGISDWCADVVALLSSRGLAQAAVLGSSLGGYLAQFIAGTHPDRISHLFAANTLHSVIGIAGRQPYSADLANAPISDLRAGFTRAMQAWGESHPEQADLVELLLAEVGGRIPEGEMRARLSALKFGPELPPSSLPPERVTTIESADDPLIPPEMRDAVRARLAPGAAFRFQWGGHFPYTLRAPLYSNLIAARLGLEQQLTDWSGSGIVQA